MADNQQNVTEETEETTVTPPEAVESDNDETTTPEATAEAPAEEAGDSE